MLGIAGVLWLMIRFGISRLPSNSRWGHIVGVGLLAGIGFTVSIFVTDIVFDQTELMSISKISIPVASIISGLVGMAVLWFMPKGDA